MLPQVPHRWVSASSAGRRGPCSVRQPAVDRLVVLESHGRQLSLLRRPPDPAGWFVCVRAVAEAAVRLQGRDVWVETDEFSSVQARQTGLAGLHRAELVRFYPDISALEADCRFSNCSHTHEPASGVRRAAEQGQLSAVRFENYQAIYSGLPD